MQPAQCEDRRRQASIGYLAAPHVAVPAATAHGMGRTERPARTAVAGPGRRGPRRVRRRPRPRAACQMVTHNVLAPFCAAAAAATVARRRRPHDLAMTA